MAKQRKVRGYLHEHGPRRDTSWDTLGGLRTACRAPAPLPGRVQQALQTDSAPACRQVVMTDREARSLPLSSNLIGATVATDSRPPQIHRTREVLLPFTLRNPTSCLEKSFGTQVSIVACCMSFTCSVCRRGQLGGTDHPLHLTRQN